MPVKLVAVLMNVRARCSPVMRMRVRIMLRVVTVIVIGGRSRVRCETAVVHARVPIHRYSGVLDLEVSTQCLLHGLHDSLRIGIVGRPNVESRQHSAGGDRPDVDVADGGDTGDRKSVV